MFRSTSYKQEKFSALVFLRTVVPNLSSLTAQPGARVCEWQVCVRTQLHVCKWWTRVISIHVNGTSCMGCGCLNSCLKLHSCERQVLMQSCVKLHSHARKMLEGGCLCSCLPATHVSGVSHVRACPSRTGRGLGVALEGRTNEDFSVKPHFILRSIFFK